MSSIAQLVLYTFCWNMCLFYFSSVSISVQSGWHSLFREYVTHHESSCEVLGTYYKEKSTFRLAAAPDNHHPQQPSLKSPDRHSDFASHLLMLFLKVWRKRFWEHDVRARANCSSHSRSKVQKPPGPAMTQSYSLVRKMFFCLFVCLFACFFKNLYIQQYSMQLFTYRVIITKYVFVGVILCF